MAARGMDSSNEEPFLWLLLCAFAIADADDDGEADGDLKMCDNSASAEPDVTTVKIQVSCCVKTQ